MIKTPPEHKIVFAIAPGENGVPIVVLGVPTGAWEYMRDGKTHSFDLTSAGIPVRIVMFGGKDNATVMQYLEGSIKPDTVDATAVDFTVKPPSKNKN